MNVKELKPKRRVVAVNLSDPPGIIAMPEYLKNRKPGASGILTGQLMGLNGCWWVRQENGTFAPYWFHELELDTSPPPLPLERGKLFNN